MYLVLINNGSDTPFLNINGLLDRIVDFFNKSAESIHVEYVKNEDGSENETKSKRAAIESNPRVVKIMARAYGDRVGNDRVSFVDVMIRKSFDYDDEIEEFIESGSNSEDVNSFKAADRVGNLFRMSSMKYSQLKPDGLVGGGSQDDGPDNDLLKKMGRLSKAQASGRSLSDHKGGFEIESEENREMRKQKRLESQIMQLLDGR